MAWGPLFSCRGSGYERVKFEDGVHSEPFRRDGFWGADYVSGLMLFLMLKRSAYKALYGLQPGRNISAQGVICNPIF